MAARLLRPRAFHRSIRSLIAAPSVMPRYSGITGSQPSSLAPRRHPIEVDRAAHPGGLEAEVRGQADAALQEPQAETAVFGWLGDGGTSLLTPQHLGLLVAGVALDQHSAARGREGTVLERVGGEFMQGHGESQRNVGAQ